MQWSREELLILDLDILIEVSSCEGTDQLLFNSCRQSSRASWKAMDAI